MTQPEPQDVRFRDAQLAEIWARAYDEPILPSVLAALYAHEINVGMQSFYDEGYSLWIGDEMNGEKADTVLSDPNEIGPWFVKTAEDYYPLLRQSRLNYSRATLPSAHEHDAAGLV